MQSVWSKTTDLPKQKELKGNIHIQNVVIGAGMAGILTAYFLQKKGLEVIVIEADKIAGGQTKNTTAKITSQHGLIYHDMMKKAGKSRAKGYAQANETAIKVYEEIRTRAYDAKPTNGTIGMVMYMTMVFFDENKNNVIDLDNIPEFDFEIWNLESEKELKRYFSSPIYMFNTSFGLLLSIVITIVLCFNDKIESSLSAFNEVGINLSMPVIFYMLILFIATLTQITASSISLEGKTINITKSLPISSKLVLKSKIFTCFVIELPFLLISDLIFIIKFRLNLLFILLILTW